MKEKKIDAIEVWKELDALAPRLGLSVIDRTVYLHLLRLTHVEGRRRLRFSILGIAPHLGLSGGPVREAVRRLMDKGALRLIERSNIGHLVEVRLPGEVRAPRARRTGVGGTLASLSSSGANLDEVDFLRTGALRQAIHVREGGVCFYLPAPHAQPGTLPGPRGAARGKWEQFVPQPGFLLYGMQLGEKGPRGRGFFTPALPRRALVRRRPQRTPARRAGARGRQAPPTGFK